MSGKIKEMKFNIDKAVITLMRIIQPMCSVYALCHKEWQSGSGMSNIALDEIYTITMADGSFEAKLRRKRKIKRCDMTKNIDKTFMEAFYIRSRGCRHQADKYQLMSLWSYLIKVLRMQSFCNKMLDEVMNRKLKLIWMKNRCGHVRL